MKKIGVFGGSFDPIHLGHTSLLEATLEACSLDLLLVLPCKQSPHKENAPIGTDEQRMKMCELACSNLEKVKVSGREILRKETPSFSWMTVEELREEYPGADLFWIMGTDQWDALEKWSRVEYLVKELTFIVAERQARVSDKEGVKCIPLAVDLPYSSSTIRNALISGIRPDGLAPEILDFIEENQLYRKII